MSAIRLIVAPVRGFANSRVFQVALVIAIILSLDHYSYDYAVLRSGQSRRAALVTRHGLEAALKTAASEKSSARRIDDRVSERPR